jgi:hypothetical protein
MILLALATSSPASQRELGEEIGIEIDLAQRSADVRLVGDDYDMLLWIVRSWHGQTTSRVPLDHAQLRSFQLQHLASLPSPRTGTSRPLTRELAADDPARPCGR